jgi:heme/copper-type cytochrome/quinol oxidase subunit 1
MSNGWTIYPPLSAMNEEPPAVQENPFEIYLKCFQILLILLLAFTAFKTGQKFNRINKEN